MVALGVLLGILGPVVAVAASGPDPLRGQQWGLDLIGIDRAWGLSRGEDVIVAVVDTGVALDHPDLFDRFVRDARGNHVGLDLVDGGLPWDTHGHGTLVAGVVAATADNGQGVAGVAPRVGLLPIRVLDARGAGAASDVDRAIRWAVDQGAAVINLSLETAVDGEGRPAVPTEAIAHAAANDVVVVVAAGNRAGSASAYPADTPALLVGAVGRDDRPAPFSDVGRTDAVLAPGVDVTSTWCRRTTDGCDVVAQPYGVAEGTSFAAPHVAGVAALLRARGLSAERTVATIRETAVDLGPPGPDPAHGVGRVDAAAALASTRTPRPARLAATARPAPPPEPEPAPAPAPVAAPVPERAPEDEPQPAPEPAPEPPPEVAEPEVPEPAPEPEPAPPSAPEPDPAPEPVAAPEPPPPPASLASPVTIGAPPGHRGLGPLDLLASGLLAVAMVAWSRVARLQERGVG